jgi:hypothetical protein
VSDDEQPTVVYVDGATNCYIPETDTVLLDGRLRDYPLAHDRIKQHELRHAHEDNKGALGMAQHELRNDLRQLFETGETQQEVRRYYADMAAQRRSWAVHANLLRSLWQVVLSPVSRLYRAVMDRVQVHVGEVSL